MNLEQQTLLNLLRQALWGEASSLPGQLDWNAVDTMAKQQGVIALAYGGAVALKAELPDELRQKWNQRTIMGAVRNERLLAVQDEVLGCLKAAGIPAAVLKGSSVSRYYPQPELRVLGDIDLLVPKMHVEQVQEILKQNKYRLHDSAHDFHIGFERKGAYVEIHYDVTRLPNCRGGEATKMEIKHFLDNCESGSVAQHRFPVLTESHQALMLLLHMVRHMTTGGGIGLRQLCDWAMYLANTDLQHFAEETVPMLDQCGLLRYAQIASSTCVHYLGLPQRCARWCENVPVYFAEAFLMDVFAGGNMGEADSVRVGRLLAQGNIAGKKSYLGNIFAGLTKLVYYHFPVIKKHKWLLPIFWVYLPLRYWVRSLLGLRQKKSVIEVAQSAKAKQDFFTMLELFETEEP